MLARDTHTKGSTTVALVEKTLTDGSSVYDIHISTAGEPPIVVQTDAMSYIQATFKYSRFVDALEGA